MKEFIQKLTEKRKQVNDLKTRQRQIETMSESDRNLRIDEYTENEKRIEDIDAEIGAGLKVRPRLALCVPVSPSAHPRRHETGNRLRPRVSPSYLTAKNRDSGCYDHYAERCVFWSVP